jgi:dTDP-4-amino-4,6-dideoxygalactose transaminase
MNLIKLAAPDIRSSDLQRVTAVLRSGNLVQGATVAEFEAGLSAFCSVRHCAVVSSGTSALHLALLGLDIGAGDSVLIPAFTFPATANAVELARAKPVLCDVDARTYVMTPEALETAIAKHRRSRLAAVMIVHEFGYPVDMIGMRKVARRHGLKLIEDAACALGTRSGGAHVGRYSDAACFSFHPRKAVTTGEGGAVLSSNAALIRKVRELRNHGIRTTAGRTDFPVVGLNYRMTEFQAALGIGQLERFGRELEKRKRLAAEYFHRLEGTPRLSLPRSDAGSSWQTFMVTLDDDVDRGETIQHLSNFGIQANLGAQAINALSYYRSRYGWDKLTCPVAYRLYRQGLALPLHGKVSTRDVRHISQVLRSFLTTSHAR